LIGECTADALKSNRKYKWLHVQYIYQSQVNDNAKRSTRSGGQ